MLSVPADGRELTPLLFCGERIFQKKNFLLLELYLNVMRKDG
jgi:hypothetical protein